MLLEMALFHFLWLIFIYIYMLLSLQSCPTLCDPTDGSPPGSPVPGILQARTLEWVAISFSNAWKWKVKGKSLSHAWLLATPWTAAYQAPLSMGFSRQEYWSGVPLLVCVHTHTHTHIFFICSSVDVHWGCFRVPAVVNSAVISIMVHAYIIKAISKSILI